jgi:hypothetical protein
MWGITQNELAMRYDISLSSTSKLLSPARLRRH